MKDLYKYIIGGAAEVPATGKLLYLMLLDLEDKNGEIIISQRKLSETLCIAKGTVSRNLCRLRDGGYISINARYHAEGGRAANKYRVR
jgi:biotin operon repressor